MEKLPISVIIIAKNAEETIGECLASVQRNNPAEIIVVDGGSTDRTLDIAQQFTNAIYFDEGRGKAFARQLGAEKATQEYIAYIDADVTLEDGALARMFAELQGSNFISMSARQMPALECRNYWGWASWQHTQLSLARRGGEYLGTMACLLRRETLLKHGFDPAGGELDDIVVEIKLQKLGHRLGVSSAIAYHHRRMSLKSFVKYRFFLGQLAPRYLKYYGWQHARFWPPLVMIYWLTFCLIKGKFKLIPYFVVNGIVQTAGMVKGLFKLIRNKLR